MATCPVHPLHRGPSIDLASILSVPTVHDALDKPSSLNKELQMYDRSRPFDPRSHDAPPAKKERTILVERSQKRWGKERPPSLLQYTKEKEINDILAQANGDALKMTR